MRKLRPRQGHALIQMDPPDPESFGGIFIPEIDREASVTGVVRAMGKWLLNRKGLVILPAFQVGNRVVINQHVGTALDGPSKDFKLVPFEQVLAVIEK